MSNITVLNNEKHVIFQLHGGKLFSIEMGVTVENIVFTEKSLIITTSQQKVYDYSNILDDSEKIKLLKLIVTNVKVLSLIIDKDDVNTWDAVLPVLVSKGIYINKYGKVIKMYDFEHLKSKINSNSNPKYINYFKKIEKVTKEELMKEIKELKSLLYEKGII